MRLIQNGDVAVKDLVGEWAGELSGLQFTPSLYYKYAVDFDGDGSRDPVHSVDDMLATAGNVLKNYGWARGMPFSQEVRVPETLPWEEADLTMAITRPRSYWARLGVTAVNGSPLANDNLPASLMLPMGRKGPAFLAFPNFSVLLRWNESLNNALSAAYFANRLLGAKPMSPGKEKVYFFKREEMRELQKRLTALGYDIGKADGRLGTGTRAAPRLPQTSG